MLKTLRIFRAIPAGDGKPLALFVSHADENLLIAAIELADSDAKLVILRDEYGPICKRINDTIQAKPIEERGPRPGSWKGSPKDEAAVKDLVARSEAENERYKAAREAYRVVKEEA